MKEKILEKLLKMLFRMLKNVDWREKLYSLWLKVVRPKLLEVVKNNDYKFDDIMFNGLDKIIENYLKPNKDQSQEMPETK